jgi:diguanylate cyclase (GGDEF)-like protein
VNDTHGHPVGDLVLRGLARVLTAEARETDLVARYGGEEFVAVLPEATGADAAAIADRIREEFGSTTVLGVDGEPLHVTVSAGCSSGDGVAPSIADLIAAADVGLQMAKRAGRDLVVAA